MKNQILFLVFLAVCIGSVFISASETVQDEKELYNEVLSEIALTRALLEGIPHVRNKEIAGVRAGLYEALKEFERTLKSDPVIYHFCGSVEKVEGENPGQRMLRIYRRETRNPFCLTMKRDRFVKQKEVRFPAGFTGFENEWSNLMDLDLVHFNVENGLELADLENAIFKNCVEKVKEMVNQKFIEQGGVLEDGKINFNKWNVVSRANIFNINLLNYRSVFIHLDEIKFNKK